MSAQAMDVRRFKRAFWSQPLCYLWVTDGRGRRVLICYRNRAELRRWLTAQSLIRRAVRRGAAQPARAVLAALREVAGL